MSGKRPYSVSEFARDLFVAALVSLLAAVLLELLRPAAVSAHVNLMLWLAVTAALGGILVAKGEAAGLGLAPGLHLLVALLVGAILMAVTPAPALLRLLLGLTGAAAVLALRTP